MTKLTGASLLQKLKEGTITSEERRLLEDWYVHYANQVAPFDDVETFRKDLLDLQSDFYRTSKAPARTRLWPKIAKVAAAAVIIFTTGFFTYHIFDERSSSDSISYSNDVLPGKQGATLTLADGKQLHLSALGDGELAQQAGITVRKTKDGQLIYELAKGAAGSDRYHTLSTAKGETYQVRLPDGSSVWLNAATSLTYHPQLQQGGKRVVKLSGEAYFEIARDAGHPFIVETNGQSITVLGTKFNVNSYEDETVTSTTLLEGSVSLKPTNGQASKLSVGQQAQLTARGLTISEVDVYDAVAWKDGVFLLGGQDLETTMRQAARWYNVEVVFEDESVKKEILKGSLSRFSNISQLLQVLESTGSVHFKVKGRRVIVVR